MAAPDRRRAAPATPCGRCDKGEREIPRPGGAWPWGSGYRNPAYGGGADRWRAEAWPHRHRLAPGRMAGTAESRSRGLRRLHAGGCEGPSKGAATPLPSAKCGGYCGGWNTPSKNTYNFQVLPAKYGAQERTRTFTALRPQVPETCASTNSATWAKGAGALRRDARIYALGGGASRRCVWRA